MPVKKMPYILAVMLCAGLLCCPVLSHADGGTAEVSTREQFENAIADASIHTIILTADVDSGFVFENFETGLPNAYRKTVARELTIKSREGQRYTLSGYAFTINGEGSATATLTLENIVIDGKIETPCEYIPEAGGSTKLNLFSISGPKATLNFNSGTRVQNFHNQYWGVICAFWKATINIQEGSEFYNLGGGCGMIRLESRYGYNNDNIYGCTLNMTGGTISNCYGYRQQSWGTYSEGCIVHIKCGSTFNMSGGRIENCGKLDYARGVIYIHPNTSNNVFRMTGGTIRDNNVTLGGAFYVANNNNNNRAYVYVGGNSVNACDNNASLLDGGKSSFYLPANLTITITDDHLTGDSMIGVYTAVAPTDTMDVKIATNAVKEDLLHFQSDRPDVAGIIYCDGENDWAYLGGVFKLADTHHTTHQAGTIWLTTAANESSLEEIIKTDYNTLLKYDANGAVSGETPIATRQKKGTVMAVEENAGNLQKNGCSFGGWNTQANGRGKTYQPGDTFTINADTTLYAIWIPDRITVTWKNEDGTVLETDENVPYGSNPHYDGKTPVKAETAKYTYTFDGWMPELSQVLESITYTAVFRETAKETASPAPTATASPTPTAKPVPRTGDNGNTALWLTLALLGLAGFSGMMAMKSRKHRKK